MHPDGSEPLAAVLSLREQWRLLLWMEAHPQALEHELTSGQRSLRPAHASRPAPLAYAVGVAVGTLWLLVRRWW